MSKEFINYINQFLQVLNNLQGLFALIALLFSLLKLKKYMKYSKKRTISGDTHNFFLFIALASIIVPIISILITFIFYFLILLLLHSIKLNSLVTFLSSGYIIYPILLFANWVIIKYILAEPRVKIQLIRFMKIHKLNKIIISIDLMLFSVSITCLGLFDRVGTILGNIFMYLLFILTIYIAIIYRDKIYIIKERYAEIYLVNGEVLSNIQAHMIKDNKSVLLIKLPSESEILIDKDRILKIIYSYKETYEPVRKPKAKRIVSNLRK